jgi:hypothetical protein
LASFVAIIVPRPDLIAIKIPDATPEIIAAYALTHEQSLLAKVRYNRLIDIFLGIDLFACRTTCRPVKDMGRSRWTRFTSASTGTASSSSFPFRPKAEPTG